MKDNPYVGPRPYEREDRQNFFGRQREARDLTALIMAERVVLFYAPSGAGKTSLLNAKVIPTLEEEGFRVLPAVRVSSTPPPIIAPHEVDNVFIFSVLMGLAGDDVSMKELTGHTLLSFLQEQVLDQKGNGVKDWGLDYRPPILILDQFEELFTTHRERWNDALDFFEQVRGALRELPSLGVIFAMREDHVAEVDPYARLLPGRLRARFRMERLDRAGALEAVRKPALNAGCPFDPGVAERLVDDLRRIKRVGESASQRDEDRFLGPHVEPVQLQVVCSRLWENLPEQEDACIQWEEVEAFGDVDQALTDFYEDALARCVEETRVSETQLRHWFGEKLITPMETRGLALRGKQETDGLPNEAVDALDELHLIRADRRAGARWYELAHDRLVDPILQSNRIWEAQRLTPLRLVAKRWEGTGRGSGILYRGQTLKEALDWAETHADEVEPYEQEFLRASQHSEQTRVKMRNLRIIIAVVAILLIIAEGVAAWRINKGRQIARSKTLAVTSARWRSINQEQSILLAREAIETADTTEARVALRQAVIDFYPSQKLPGEIDHVCSMAYGPDGRFVAASTADAQVQIWDTRSRSLHMSPRLRIENAETAWTCWGLAYSPDGRFVAASGDDNSIHIWDVSSAEGADVPGADVAVLNGHTGPVYSLAYSPDGRLLASGANDMSVRLWDVSQVSTGERLDLEPLVTLTGHERGIPGLDFSPDGRLLVSGSWDRTVRLWELSGDPGSDLTARAALTLTGHTAAINAVALSPAGDLAASCANDKTIRLWDAATGQPALTLVGHDGSVTSISFSADGRYLISGSRDATVRIWDVGLRKREEVAILTGHTSVINDVAYSPAGRLLASGSADQMVRIWDSAPEEGAMLTTFAEHSGRVGAIAYSSDGAFIASGGSEGIVHIWSTSTGRTVMKLPVGSQIWLAAYSPTGDELVTCSADDKVRVWDLSDGKSVTLAAILTEHSEDVIDAAYSPDGRFLVTASDDKLALVWDTATWEKVHTLEGHTSWVNAAAYSPDGRLIATGGGDNEVRIWDAESGALLATLRGHQHQIYSLAFHPDGEELASASWDHTVKLWDMETFTDTETLSGHAGYVYDVEYSPDGEHLASCSWDRTVRIWDLSQSAPQTIAILTGHDDYVTSVDYSPDGKYIASGSSDGTIRRYLARFEDVLELARQYAPRELTTEERISILGERE
jgi:WD40 repeat protein